MGKVRILYSLFKLSQFKWPIDTHPFIGRLQYSSLSVVWSKSS